MTEHRDLVRQTKANLQELLQDLDLPSEVGAIIDQAYQTLDEYYLRLCLKESTKGRRTIADMRREG